MLGKSGEKLHLTTLIHCIIIKRTVHTKIQLLPSVVSGNPEMPRHDPSLSLLSNSFQMLLPIVISQAKDLPMKHLCDLRTNTI